MANIRKDSLDYFPFDVAFFSDKKIKRLRTKFGNNGVCTLIYIYTQIYAEGYYIPYDEDLILDISDEMNISENETRQILAYLFSRSMLDGTLAESVKVLTAISIQKRYQEAKRGLKRDVFVKAEYWLLEPEETLGFIKVWNNENKSEKNDQKSRKNSDKSGINSQRKGKESKGKESKDITFSDENVCCTRNEMQRAIDAWNDLNLAPVKKIAPDTTRYKQLQARIRQNGIDEVVRVIQSVKDCSFLMGNNKSGWTITFDWIILPNNFPKVQSGNYLDRNENNKATTENTNLTRDLFREDGD